MSAGNRVAEPVIIGVHNLEFADTFNYPRSTICYDGSASTEIGNGLSKERSTLRG